MLFKITTDNYVSNNEYKYNFNQWQSVVYAISRIIKIITYGEIISKCLYTVQNWLFELIEQLKYPIRLKGYFSRCLNKLCQPHFILKKQMKLYLYSSKTTTSMTQIIFYVIIPSPFTFWKLLSHRKNNTRFGGLL